MKKIYLFLVLSYLSFKGYSQTAASYSFSAFPGTYTSIAGATGTVPIILPGDNVSYGPLPVGFTFKFCGINYTTLSATTNGFISLANDTSTAHVNSALNVASAGWIMPYWDDLTGIFISGASTTPSLYYATTGAAPNRVFTFEWKDFNIAGSSCVSCKANFQVKLYETSNGIDFVYGASGFTGMSATIGIANSTTDWQTLPNTGSTPVPSSSTFSTGLTGSPTGAQIYRWGIGCTGTPVAGSVSASIDTGCTAYSSVLSLPGGAVGIFGINYQWQSSPGGAIWSNVLGATNITDTALVSSSIYYRCIATCGFSGQSDTSAGKKLFLSPPAAITGPATICRDSVITLTDDSLGGVWSSNNSAKATIDSLTGTIRCVSAGTDTFIYSFYGCSISKVVKFDSLNAGSIFGDGGICPWGASYSDSIHGGVWSVTNPALATVSNTGFARSLGNGIDTIVYTVTNSCGVTETALQIGCSAPCEGFVRTTLKFLPNFRLFPNPNSGTFSVKVVTSNTEQVNLVVSDLSGRQLKRYVTSTNKDFEIKTNLPAGMYFVSAATSQGNYVAKLVVE